MKRILLAVCVWTAILASSLHPQVSGPHSEQACRVATLRAELRWVHLSAHVVARKLLTPEQLVAYQQIRHGSRPAASA